MRCTLAVWPKTFFYAGNASIKKEKFHSLGGFDGRFFKDAWDDFEFGLRWAASGGYSQFVAGATAIHRHAVSFDERCSNMQHAGKADRVLAKLHPNLDHAWRTIINRDNEPINPSPEVNASTYTWIAFFVQQLDVAFRRGYLDAVDEYLISNRIGSGDSSYMPVTGDSMAEIEGHSGYWKQGE